MQSPISKQIIENWISTMEKKKVEPIVVDSLKALSEKGLLKNESKLKGVISEIEGHYAKHQDSDN